MKVLEFNYAKSPSDVSKRVLMVIAEPSKNYFGIDITSLSDEDANEFITRYNRIKDYQNSQVANLMSDFDLKHNYRNFDPTKMENVNEETS